MLTNGLYRKGLYSVHIVTSEFIGLKCSIYNLLCLYIQTEIIILNTITKTFA